jgi:hypothetical protein
MLIMNSGTPLHFERPNPALNSDTPPAAPRRLALR